MPKRVIDFDAMWASDKLAACAEWAQAEYAWLYGLADCAGCFELTNLRVIWGRVAAIRRNFSIERLEQVVDEFHDKRLLFIWSENGKRYGHWTGSDVPGRLPPPSWRNRLERLAPPVPREQLEAFLAAGIETRNESPQGANNLWVIAPLTGAMHSETKSEKVSAAPRREPGGSLSNICACVSPLKPRLEVAQAQDLNVGLDLEGKWSEKTHTASGEGELCREDPRQSEKQNRVSDSGSQSPGEEKPKGSCLENESNSNAPPVRSGAGYNNRQNTIRPGEVGLCGAASPNQQNSGNCDGKPETQTLRFGEPDLHKPTPGTLAEIWEQERRTLPELLGLTPERVAHCRERFANACKGEGGKPDVIAQFLADFREAVRRAAATPFLCGAGPAGWRANFDWFIANDTNYLKVLEGRYDAGAGKGANEQTRARVSGAAADWPARGLAREESARRMARVGTGPVAHPSVRVRADVLNRALHRV